MRSSRAGKTARAPGVGGGFVTTTWRVLAVALLLGMVATQTARAQAVEQELYRLDEAIAQTSRDAGRSGQPLRSWRVRSLSPDPNPQTLRVTLPDGRRLRVRRTTARTLDDDGQYWAGDAADATGARVRLVSRRGVLVGSVPNAFRLQSRLRFLRGRPPEDDPTHLRMFSPDAIRALLAGFDDVRVEFVGGRFAGLHGRLLARDLVFAAVAPAD